MNDADFIYRDLPVVKKRAHRLGLAFNFGIDPAGVEAGLDAGINYLFWAKFRKGPEHEVIKAALKRDRERYILASGASFGFLKGASGEARKRYCAPLTSSISTSSRSFGSGGCPPSRKECSRRW